MLRSKGAKETVEVERKVCDNNNNKNHNNNNNNNNNSNNDNKNNNDNNKTVTTKQIKETKKVVEVDTKICDNIKQ